MCEWLSADLIHELDSESVRVVDRRVVRLKGDADVLALSWRNASLYWPDGENTQSTVVLGPCMRYKRQAATSPCRLLVHLLPVFIMNLV